MGEHASQIQSALRDRLAASRPVVDWDTEYDLGGTRVDVAGHSSAALVLVELEWRRADPVSNTATLFRHLAEGVLSRSTARPVVVVQLFTAHYDLASGGVSGRRADAEFVGRRIAASFPHVSYHAVSLDLSPPRADGTLPDDWREAVDDAAERVLVAVDAATEPVDGQGD
jgi:hypothetical protein